MDTSTSSEELDTSLESVSSSVPEGQIGQTTPLRPSPFTLRSQCAHSHCPQGAGILFRSRISPSPSKQDDDNYIETRSGNRYPNYGYDQRVKPRRRRRSDQNKSRLSDSSSFLELSHENGHVHLHTDEHLHRPPDDYPHDGIHNIDHHHVHLQSAHLQKHLAIERTPPAVTEVAALRLHESLGIQTHGFGQPQHIRLEELRQKEASYFPSYEYPTKADILFEEMQKEEERRKLMALNEMAKERTVTTTETTTTTVRRSLMGQVPDEGQELGQNGGVANLAETVKNTVIGFLTPSKETTLPSIVESSESGFEDGNVIGDQYSTPGTNEPFRPAREFFAENDTRERLTSDFFSGSDTPSKLRESTRRLSIRKPHNKYIAYSSDEEYEDWREQPKSDYTYSTSLSYRRRVTPDRKIGSPNMSRRTLKGGVTGFMGSPDFTTTLENEEASSTSSNSYLLRSRTIFKNNMDTLSDTSDGEEIVEQQSLPRSRRSTRSRSIEVPRSNGSLSRTVTTTTTEFATTKTLHYGLDAESDVEDNTKSAVPDRAMPLLGRGGTPLGRAMTPLSTLKISSRKSSSASIDGSKGFLDAGKGYTIGEGTIAEDVEEDEDETQGNILWRWSRKTIEVVTRITTIVTASAAMMATQAFTAATSASSKEKLEVDEKTTSVSTVELITTKYHDLCERLRKNPIWIWIPLLLILLLLALAAYWWLLQPNGNTAAGASDPTENDRPNSSFLLLFLTAFQNLISGMSSLIANVWSSTATVIGVPLSLCQSWLSICYTSIGNGFIWLGSSTLSLLSWLWQLIILGFNFLLTLPYLAYEYLSFLVIGVYSFLSSSASYLYGFLPFASSNDSRLEETDLEKESFSFVAWVSNFSPAERLSGAYVVVSETAQSSKTALWDAWLWLVVGVGEIFSALASYGLWGLSSILAAAIYILTGLWMMMTYIWFSLVGLLWTIVTALSSLAPSTSTPVSIQVPKETVVQPPPVANFSYLKVEEIVQEVLDSEKLKSIIAAAVAEKSDGQLTVDDVYAAAKSVIETELGVVKEEMAVLKTEVDRNSAASLEHQKKIIQLQGEKAELIEKLLQLGQRLYSVEEKIEAADAKSLQDRGELEGQIEQVIQQINKLEVDHANLAADVKSCCNDDKVPVILGKLFGLTSSSSEGGAEQPDIGAWMKSYFVAKDELAEKLSVLTANMQVKPDDDAAQATVTQTTQIVMGAVLAKLQEEMSKQQQQNEETQKQILNEVSLQVKEASTALKKQVLEEILQQLQMENVEMKANLEENMNLAVIDRVHAAVDIAVDKAVASAVNIAVPSAIEKSIPEAVKDILPMMVAEEVAASVPEVVASAVPAAVTSAVSEAMVHVSESQTGDQATEVDGDGGKNEIVGVTGSASVNISHDGRDNLFIPGMGGLNQTQVLKIVQDALRKYDADKTGMVDHALESAGGNIISTRCTENYQGRQAEVLVLGYAIYSYSTNNPRTVIQPDTMPGQCWAFKGSQGYIVIQLAGDVKPTGFTMEHIPKELSPNGAIDSAPKGFEVWGLMSENDEGILLGTYEYVDGGDPLQYFQVTTNDSNYFPLIELKINSNHGNLNYTCLYRFRVHGVRLY